MSNLSNFHKVNKVETALLKFGPVGAGNLAGFLRGISTFLPNKICSNLVYKQLNAISIDTERPKKIHLKIIGLLFITYLFFKQQVKENLVLETPSCLVQIGFRFHRKNLFYP